MTDAGAAKPSIVVASDHAGVDAKRAIVEAVAADGYPVRDLGPETTDSVDYPDYAEEVGRAVLDGKAEFGVLVCGTGTGMVIAANKINGIRAALLYDDLSARFARRHNDANVAVFGARTMSVEQILTRLRLFLSEPFEGGRHANRVGKIRKLEDQAPRQ